MGSEADALAEDARAGLRRSGAVPAALAGDGAEAWLAARYGREVLYPPFQFASMEPYEQFTMVAGLIVAIAETLPRDLPTDHAGVLLLPRARIRGRRINAIETTADLTLVSLRTAADLAAVSQDTWLTSCGPHFYAKSRHWAHWISGHAQAVSGYVWTSHREPTQQAVVLFGDRPPRTR